MNLVDALCIIASSYNARSKEEEQIYTMARNLVEDHADRVVDKYRQEVFQTPTDVFEVIEILATTLRTQ